MEIFDLLFGVSFEVIHGKLRNTYIRDIVFDSRKDVNDCAFVCIKGSKYDSHVDFEKIVDNGAKCIIVDRDIKTDKDILVLKVANTRKALSYLSINYFNKPHKKLHIIGITGTKGKTSTALMIKKMLDKTDRKVGLIGSMGVTYNDKNFQMENMTPNPYILQEVLRDMVDSDIDTVIIEVSEVALRQERVTGIHFDIAVLTNIMPDYLDIEDEEKIQEYVKNKISLFNKTDISILNGDDRYLDIFRKNISSDIFTYGLTADVNFRADNVSLLQGNIFGLCYDIYDLKRTHVEVYQIGRQNIYNSLAALHVMQVLGYDLTDYVDILKDIKIKGRAEFVNNDLNKKIFIDCAVRPIGFSSIFEAISEYKEDKLISVFSVDERSCEQERMDLVKIACKYSDICILVTHENNILGKEIEKYIIGTNRICHVYNTRKEAIELAINMSNNNDIILLLGTGRYDKSIFTTDYDIVKNILVKNNDSKSNSIN